MDKYLLKTTKADGLPTITAASASEAVMSGRTCNTALTSSSVWLT